MRYLIVGTGGVGGSIAAFLALNGNTVICIARGQHKENMLSSGFKVHLGIQFGCDILKRSLAIIDNSKPENTASLQKDLKRGHKSEIQGQLFDLLNACRREGVPAPAYERVAEKFKDLGHVE